MADTSLTWQERRGTTQPRDKGVDLVECKKCGQWHVAGACLSILAAAEQETGKHVDE